MKILDGQKIADEISLDLKKEIEALAKKNIVPKLHIYLVGDNPASLAYVAVKQKKAAELKAKCIVKKYPHDANIEDIIPAIKKDNQDKKCHGIIIQLPLPSQIDPNILLQEIDPNKDVDGLTYLNQWKLMYGIPDGYTPATAKGIMSILDHYKIPIEGKKVVVVGRSRLVGLPTSLLLLQENATITICHSHTKNLAQETSSADILIVAAGQPQMINKKHVKKNAVVIDVGISRQANNQLIGDVNFAKVQNEIRAITPVPKGVGPMTVVSLFQNLLDAVRNNSIDY